MVVDIVVILGTVATDTETDTGPVVERVGAWVVMGAEATAVGVAGIIELGKLADAPSSLQPRWTRPARAWPKDGQHCRFVLRNGPPRDTGRATRSTA